MTRNLIRDGYTKQGRIKEEDWIHGELSFEFRPMLADEVELIETEVSKRLKAGKPKEATGIISQSVARQLVSWSEEDEAGGMVPIKPEIVARLPYLLLYKTFNICKGIAPSMPPGEPEPETGGGESEDFLAYLGTEAPGIAEMKDDQKN